MLIRDNARARHADLCLIITLLLVSVAVVGVANETLNVTKSSVNLISSSGKKQMFVVLCCCFASERAKMIDNLRVGVVCPSTFLAENIDCAEVGGKFRI